jgi:REP element-mobilizing transposase RayT
MAFWRLYYHLVWATKERHPLITSDIEQELYGYIIGKAIALGCITHAVGGIEDHIHLVSSIPPKLSIADFVQKIKGSSAYHLNHGLFTDKPKFQWQRGYGVFSLGSKQLLEAVTYVVNQKEHHQQGTIIPAMERCDEEDDGPAPWNNGEAIARIKVIGGSSADFE